MTNVYVIFTFTTDFRCSRIRGCIRPRVSYIPHN